MPILCVHQVGKVGSTTVARALQRMFPAREIHQTHCLSERGVLKAMEWWLENDESPRFRLPNHICRSIDLRRHFTNARSSHSARWYLFTLVRDPIGRNVSSFFQNLHNVSIHHLPAAAQESCRRILAGDETVSSEDRRALVESLIARFKAEYRDHPYDEWFEAEIRELFGIDVLAKPFQPERGYDVYEAEGARLVVVRLEDLHRVFQSAVGEWLDGSGLSPEDADAVELDSDRANDGSSKAYSDLYRAFRSEFRITAAESERLFSSPILRHFYTAQERERFCERWSPQLAEASA